MYVGYFVYAPLTPVHATFVCLFTVTLRSAVGLPFHFTVTHTGYRAYTAWDLITRFTLRTRVPVGFCGSLHTFGLDYITITIATFRVATLLLHYGAALRHYTVTFAHAPHRWDVLHCRFAVTGCPSHIRTRLHILRLPVGLPTCRLRFVGLHSLLLRWDYATRSHFGFLHVCIHTIWFCGFATQFHVARAHARLPDGSPPLRAHVYTRGYLRTHALHSTT